MPKCPGHQRHWFTKYGQVGIPSPVCVRCGAPNPRHIVHCWVGKADQYEIGTNEWAEAVVHGATCLLPDGHDGPHEWTSDDEFVIEFAKKEE